MRVCLLFVPLGLGLFDTLPLILQDNALANDSNETAPVSIENVRSHRNL